MNRRAPAAPRPQVGVPLELATRANNSVGVGTTQLYDKTVVYNHKRHGNFSLGWPQVRISHKTGIPEESQPGIPAG
jgi:hypothetical protein